MKPTMTISHVEQGQRLDQWLASTDTTHSRSRWQQLIIDGKVLINGEIKKPSYRLETNDLISFLPIPLVDIELKPEAIPLDIVYQDEAIAVINKPQGMVVHPAPGHLHGTLVHALLFHLKDLSGLNGEKRPGIVHRLDKDTSGLLVVAKHDQAHRILAEQLSNHSMKRDYLALVRGVIKENKGKIIAPIGRDPDERIAMNVMEHGKPAETTFEVLERFPQHTLVMCHLATGRTHQIRVHFQFIHHPIESDPVYMPQKYPLHPLGQMLHAFQLTLVHPITNKVMVFQANRPAYFDVVINKLKT